MLWNVSKRKIDIPKITDIPSVAVHVVTTIKAVAMEQNGEGPRWLMIGRERDEEGLYASPGVALMLSTSPVAVHPQESAPTWTVGPHASQ